jgi:hypothetical protein
LLSLPSERYNGAEEDKEGWALTEATESRRRRAGSEVRGRPRAFLAGIALLVLPAVLGACTSATWQIQRAALVPTPTPPMWSGRMAPHGIALGSETVVWAKPPSVSPDAGVGLYVPRVNLDSNFRIRLGENWALWVPMAYGLSETAFDTLGTQIECPSGGVFTGGGLGVAASYFLTHGLYLGMSFEAMFSAIPSHIKAKTEHQSWDEAKEWEETELIGMVRGGLVLGYDFGSWRIFAGLSARNHPTNLGSSQQTVTWTSEIEPEVDFGHLFMIAGGGVEVDLGRTVSLMFHAYEPFGFRDLDIVYAPILGVMVDLHVAR